MGRCGFILAAVSAGVLCLEREHPAIAAPLTPASQRQDQYFEVKIVDDVTGRGVPLVELKLTNAIRYYSDSNGIVAFFEPGLMERAVWFYIQSAGYEFPEKPFGERGKVLRATCGGSVTMKIHRLNVAERLYRLTGEGIYRDSVLVRAPVPIKHPLLDAEVMGQDTVVTALYRGKIYWIFGDTGRMAFHLGNFGTSGATSELPDKGGLDPSAGVDLSYFSDASGFSRPMIPARAVPGPGPKWTDAMMVVEDDHGVERLVAHYIRVKTLGEIYEQGLIIFNDEAEIFDRLAQFDLKIPLGPAGRPFRVRTADDWYFYFPSPYPAPLARVKADLQHITHPESYEGFTCLAAGTKYQGATTRLDRGADGGLIYDWKRGTPGLDFMQQRELVAAGRMKPEEGLGSLIDIETGALIEHTIGTVYWNDYRRRWIMITLRNLEEVWYVEGDTPLGPWLYARKVAVHGHYTFYWPAQFPFLDQEGGRVIYLAGTYTNTFSGNPDQIPRYDYNQLMYRLDLADPRLFLPVPIYRVTAEDGSPKYMTREVVEEANAWDRIESVPFFALPPNRALQGLLPISVSLAGGLRAAETEESAAANTLRPLFYALPTVPWSPPQKPAGQLNGGAKGPVGAEFITQQEKSPAVLPLYEYQNRRNGVRAYSTDAGLNEAGTSRVGKPLCRVWRNPQSLLLVDRHARPF